MISKFLRFHFKCSNKQAKKITPILQKLFSEEKQRHGRQVEADQENPVLTNKRERISKGKLFTRCIWWGSLFIFGYNLYLQRTSNKPSDEIGAFPGFLQAAEATNDYFNSCIDFFTKPPLKKLLPDQPQIPGMQINQPKTLVLNLTGTLVHTEYVFGKGAVNLKRPGLNQFLQKLSQMYEVVIFSSEDTMFTMQIVEKLDPGHSIFSGYFGLESNVYDRGQYVKDITYLNRDLKKIVVVDYDINKLKYQPENGIFIKEFKGEVDDKSLFELLPLLEYLANPEVKDIRAEIQKFGNVEPQKKYLEMIEDRREALKKKQGLAGVFKGMSGQNQNNRFSQKF